MTIESTSEIPLPTGHVVLVSKSDIHLVAPYRWRTLQAQKKVYARASSGGKWILMHRLLMGVSDSSTPWVDHIDGNGLNNTRGNLRLVSRQQNRWNAVTNAKSGYKGVIPNGDGWTCQFFSGGQRRYGGFFKTAIEAAVAYNIFAKRLHGDHARLNQIDRDEALNALHASRSNIFSKLCEIEQMIKEVG